MSNSLALARTHYRPEAIWDARHAFFQQGSAPVGLVQDAVLRSWRRCSDGGLTVDEPVAFQPVNRAHVSRLMQQHQVLLEAAQPELNDLAASVRDAGYAVLLTDRNGMVLAVDGSIAQRSQSFQLAFRAGVDLSEASIGTTAMSVAIQEAQPVRVLGAEHFYTEAQIFHCSAAPVFDPHGEVLGAVDVSRDMPGMIDSTLWLSARCAQRIERRLFRSLRASVCVEIDASSGNGGGVCGSGAWLAFGDSGELIAANRAARSLMGLPTGALSLSFDQLFDERFGAWVSALRRSPSGAPLRLQEGVQLLAMPMAGVNAAKAPRGLPVTGSTAVLPPPLPEFGDPRIAKDFERTRRALAAGLTLLVNGETGTGKEVAARALHASGSRASGPFVALNCAALPGELLAAELFGHVEGAFTGSRRAGALGKVEASHGGTLFLDEIGDMPLSLQVALLRVIDSKEVVRLGCNEPRTVDVSVICATHRDLGQLVALGQFREDLMYRLCGHVLHLPPLRDRSDFDAVLDAVLRRLHAAPERVGPTLRAALRARPWLGNVRQLAHAVQRALALAELDAELTVDDFGCEIQQTVPMRPQAQPGSLKAMNDQAIDTALQQASGNVSHAAQLLGIGRATLYRKLKLRSMAARSA